MTSWMLSCDKKVFQAVKRTGGPYRKKLGSPIITIVAEETEVFLCEACNFLVAEKTATRIFRGLFSKLIVVFFDHVAKFLRRHLAAGQLLEIIPDIVIESRIAGWNNQVHLIVGLGSHREALI